MSEENQSSGQPDQTSGQNPEKKDFVKHETYMKVLSEAKAAKAKLAEFEAQVERDRQAKLEAEGKSKELAEEYKRKFEEAEKKSMTFAKTYGQKVFTAETKSVALELGANPEAVEDLIKTGDWSDVEIGQDFSVDREKIKASLVRMQQQKPWFFRSQVTPPRDVNPGSKVATGSKSPNEMSVEELIEFAKKNFK